MLPASGEIRHVLGARGSEFTAIDYEVRDAFTLALKPWPFSEPALEFVIQTRRLNERIFPNQVAFLDALQRTRFVPAKVSIVAM